MSYAITKVAELTQQKQNAIIEKVAQIQLTHDEEEKRELEKELKQCQKDLKVNNRSAVQILQAQPKKVYEEFRAPDHDEASAIQEFERKRRSSRRRLRLRLQH